MPLDTPIYKIREATAADAAIVAAHRASMFYDMGALDEPAAKLVRTASEPWIDAMLRDKSYAGWLIQQQEIIVGGAGRHLATFGPKPGFPAGGRSAHIANVFIEPEHRRRGLAKHLLQLMLQWAKSASIGEITLSASHQAEPLYTQLGFTRRVDLHILKL